MRRSEVFLPDTNTLLRHLLNDEKDLSAKANDFWEDIREGTKKAELTEGVLMECVYVLQRFYKVPRDRILAELSMILRYKGLVQENIELFDMALSVYGAAKLDFVDCLLASRAKLGRGKVFSFDQKLSSTIRKK